MLFAKNLYKLVVPRVQTPILHTSLPVTFLLANFLHFSQQIPNQRKILSCFDTHIQIL
jgi:hypothetical protein